MIGKVMRCIGKNEWEIMFLDGTSEVKSSNVLTIEPDKDFDDVFKFEDKDDQGTVSENTS